MSIKGASILEGPEGLVKTFLPNSFPSFACPEHSDRVSEPVQGEVEILMRELGLFLSMQNLWQQPAASRLFEDPNGQARVQRRFGQNRLMHAERLRI